VSPQSTPLRKGYTTGVHAAIAFASALEGLLGSRVCTTSTTCKMENDDLDVTKGCKIVATLSYRKEDIPLNPIAHTPYQIGTLRLYAGRGVGVVTKTGLKAPKGYPAINPVPLKAIEAHYAHICTVPEETIYASISVLEGEEIAKQTANAKVGVLGGISILGTTGFVKPVSSAAYIDSIATEIAFAKANGYGKIVLTLGNSSFSEAKKHYPEEQIVEIGNFVYDALKIAKEKGFKEVVFVCGIGKATKVMQGHKNTHNRFGQINFEALKIHIADKLGIEIDTEVTKTVKGITTQLNEKQDAFYSMVKRDTQTQIENWFPALQAETVIVR